MKIESNNFVVTGEDINQKVSRGRVLACTIHRIEGCHMIDKMYKLINANELREIVGLLDRLDAT